MALFAVLALGVWLVASVFTACVPLEAFWNWWLVFVRPVYCQPATLWWANAGLHIASDVMIFLLPLPMLSTLSLPRKQKIALVGVFALGFLYVSSAQRIFTLPELTKTDSVCVVSILRLVNLIKVETTSPIDASYNSAELAFWTVGEVNTAISCACIMTLKPLIVHFFPRFLAEDSCVSQPTLHEVTTRSRRSSAAGTSSRQSFAREGSDLRQGQPMSEAQTPRTGVFPRFHGDDAVLDEAALKNRDIEAQRDESVASSIPDEEPTFPRGIIRPPQRMRPASYS